MKRIKWFLFGIALVLQFTPLEAAQKKEQPFYRPITVQPDAQKKEQPFYRPIVVVVRDWFAGILPNAQRKE